MVVIGLESGRVHGLEVIGVDADCLEVVACEVWVGDGDNKVSTDFLGPRES